MVTFQSLLITVAPSATLELSQKLHSIPVQHWDRCVQKSISLPDESDAYLQLRCNILFAFQEEINYVLFKLYYLPYDFKDVEERVRISSSRDWDDFAALYLNTLKTDQGPPLLFVFNTSAESSSPAKLPAAFSVSTSI